jgi:hypothetical protein
LDKFSDGTLDAIVAENALAVLGRLCAYGREAETQSQSVYEELCRDLDDYLEIAAVQWYHRHPVPIPFTPGSDYDALG